MRAAVSSGRSDFAISAPLNAVRPTSGPGASFSIGAAADASPAGSNAVARTVITLMGSADWTVAMTLPA